MSALSVLSASFAAFAPRNCPFSAAKRLVRGLQPCASTTEALPWHECGLR